MKMNEEMAVRLHRMMWSDMQKELGDHPSEEDRIKYKVRWVEKHFPGKHLANNCWLCEYVVSFAKPSDHELYCKYCPISWPNRHCNTLDFSYASSPISEILALPARNPSLDSVEADSGYHKFREGLLGKYSGLPSSAAIMEHVAKIRDKAQDAAFKAVKHELSENSGLDVDASLGEHIRAIQEKAKEKAVEEYFAKTPGAKLATMDVDNAFKQYADEQKAPIFKALSKASGLSEHNHNVLDHINWIKLKDEQEIHHALKEKNASIFKELAAESGLDPTATVKAHINAIYSNGFDNGKDEEFERIMDKIQEILKK